MLESREEDFFFLEMMHFHNMTYMATSQHKNHNPGDHEIYHFGRPFLGDHYFILFSFQFVWIMPRSRELDQFYTSYPKINFPWMLIDWLDRVLRRIGNFSAGVRGH